MTRRSVLYWGFGLWAFGYLLGFLFFAFVPPAQIGWYVMPLGIAATAWVLWRYVCVADMRHALMTGVVWAVLAVVLDYLGIVILLHPADGYYKPDVYLYYVLTFLMPLGAAWLRRA